VTSTLWRPPPLGPGGRPFRGWRAVPLLLSLVALAVNAVLLLSDRAPGFLSRVSARIDAGVHRAAGAAGVDVPGGSVRVPQSDFDVHVAIWALAALLVGLGMWSWASLVMASAAVLVASGVLELAQQAYSRSRSVQIEDMLGNTLGVVTGTCAVAAFALVWRLFFSTRRAG
jgi:hypothetical protein